MNGDDFKILTSSLTPVIIESTEHVSDPFKLPCVFPINSFMTGPLSYRNQSIDLLCKSVDWFLYDNGLHHERVNRILNLQDRKLSTLIIPK